MEFVLIAIAILVVALIAGISLLVGRGRRTARLDDDARGRHDAHPAPPARSRRAPPVEQPDAVGPGRRRRPVAPPAVELPPAEPEPGLIFETPPPSAGRLVRLRSRLARSQSSLGRGLLTVLAREKLTEDDWEEVEETLLAADVGVAATTQIVERLRTQSLVLATASGAELRDLLVGELTAVLGPDLDRTLGTDRHDGRPGVVLVVGRQRRRQDDDGRQDRPRARRRRQERRPRCRRHLPRRRRRPAGDLGRAGRRPHRPRPRGRRPGVGGLRGRPHRRRGRGRHRRRRHRRAGCTPSRA